MISKYPLMILGLLAMAVFISARDFPETSPVHKADDHSHDKDCPSGTDCFGWPGWPGIPGMGGGMPGMGGGMPPPGMGGGMTPPGMGRAMLPPRMGGGMSGDGYGGRPPISIDNQRQGEDCPSGTDCFGWPGWPGIPGIGGGMPPPVMGGAMPPPPGMGGAMPPPPGMGGAMPPPGMPSYGGRPPSRHA